MDENTSLENDATDSEQPGTQPAEGAKARLYTEDEVNRIVTKRLARVKQEPRAEVKTEADPDAKVSKRELMARIEAQDARFARQEARHSFDKTAAKYGLDDEATEILFLAFEAQKPSDAKAWFDSKVGLFGQKTVNPTNSPNQAVDSRPPVAAASTPPAKVNPVTTGGVVDVFALSPEQLSTLSADDIRKHVDGMMNQTRALSGAPRLPQPNRK